MDNTIEIGVRVNRQDLEREFGGTIPSKARESWEKIQREIAQGPSTLGKAFQERMGGVVGNLERISEQAAGQRFFTPSMRREFEKNQRELTGLYRRFMDDRIATVKGSGGKLEQEIRDLEKRLADAWKSGSQAERQAISGAYAQKMQELERFQAGGGAGTAVEQEKTRGRQLKRMIDEMSDEAANIPTITPEEEQQRRGGFGGRALQFGLQFGRGLIGGTVIAGAGYLIASKVRQQFHDEVERGIAVADMYQRLGGAMPFPEFRQMVEHGAPAFTPAESTRFLSTYGPLVGARNLPYRLIEAERLTRLRGFSPEQGAGYFGQAGQLGLTDQGQRKFARLIAEAVAEGRIRGREAEVYESIIKLGEAVTTRSGLAANENALAGMIGRLSATQIPGLQGARGANILARVDQAISSTRFFGPPQGMKEAIALEAFPGKSIVEINKILEQGIQNPEALAQMLRTGLRRYGGNPVMRQMLAMAYTIPLNVQEEVFKAATEPGGPKRIPGILEREEARMPAQIREEWAKTAQMMSEGARKMEPAYAGLLRETNKLISAFGTLHQTIEKRTGSESIANWTVGGLILGGGIFAKDIVKGVGRMAWRYAFPTAKEAAGIVWKPAAEALGPVAGTASRIGGAASLVAALPFLAPGDVPPKVDLSKEPGLINEIWKKEVWDRFFPASKTLGTTPPPPVTPQERQLFTPEIKKGAKVSGLPQELIRGVISRESNFNPYIVSPVGATGLMQLMPKSFPTMSKADLFDPGKNVPAGSRYLRQMIDKFGGVEKGLAAYNWGPGNMQSLLQKHATDWQKFLPEETRAYISAVIKKTLEFTPPKETPIAAARANEMNLSGQINLKIDLQHPDGSTTSTTHTVPASSLKIMSAHDSPYAAPVTSPTAVR